MLEPWNSKTIQQPPIHTIRTSKLIDVNDLKHTCKNIIRTLSKQSPLHKESALLSRFLYKYDKKFRNDLGYLKFKKVNTGLRKYLTLDLMKDVTNFLDALPSDDDQYLPTKQMLQYVLVRLMTFSKLMLRINVCSKQAAIFYLYRVKSGESHWMSLMPYSLLSRIWSLTLVLLQHSCNWYNRLYHYLSDLQSKGLDFLEEGYELPKNLEHWIDLKNVNDFGRFNWSEKLSTNINSIIIENDNGGSNDNILQYVDNINTEEGFMDEDTKLITKQPEMTVTNDTVLKRNDDKGEAISRDSFKNLTTPITTQSNDKKREEHNFENVTNRNKLKEFLDNETIYRNNDNEMAVTGHLSFMQWEALRTSLLKLDNNVINNIKLQKKAQKIWKDKCLNYLYM